MNNLALEISGLTKRFRWYERSRSLKESFTRILKPPKEKWEWDVLKNISINIEKGEKVGIIGKNGSGKSTLLKIITGIHLPSAGKINVHSERMLALIELGIGFYSDLTGRENISLNWVFNGLPKSLLKERFDEIVEFSGVKEFLDTPLKYYSSGMITRLGFSVAIHANPDLLIVDEVLAVGDIEFQQQCYAKIKEVCDSGTTLILVSHNMSDIVKVCDRAIWLDKGEIVNDGPAKETIKSYLHNFDEVYQEDLEFE
ncbi:MAG: ABC transporter ATP-binding protein [Ignavibacteriales bacterium]|nr:ABC transporter ATP-binding protein [Ignavibacteriales bacterium]